MPMSSPASPSHPAPGVTPRVTPGADAAATTEHLRTVLLDLVTMGHALARRVHDDAMAEPAPANDPGDPEPRPAPRPDPTVAFERAARTVRRTILLIQRLAAPPAPSRAAPRRQLLRAVEDAIDRAAFRAAPAPLDTDSLHAELHERLDSPDLDDELGTRPVAEIVAEICRDLGLTEPLPFLCPPRRRTPADVAGLHARAAALPGARPPTTPRPAPARPATPPTAAPPNLDAMMALAAHLARDG